VDQQDQLNLQHHPYQEHQRDRDYHVPRPYQERLEVLEVQEDQVDRQLVGANIRRKHHIHNYQELLEVLLAKGDGATFHPMQLESVHVWIGSAYHHPRG